MKSKPSLLFLRNLAIDFFQAGIAAADPYEAVKRYIAVENGQLNIRQDNNWQRTGDWQKIHLIAFGKAACPMLKAALDVIPDKLIGATIAVTNVENIKPLDGVEVIGASHPLPDEAGFKAAKRCAEIALKAEAGELVLVLVGGGGSALIPYPVDPVSLQDKIRATQLLLASGATINEMNCVRKHLSQLKGGGLARFIAPADCHALILSDVIGDELSAIASGPTVPDETTFEDAASVLQRYRLWEKVPETIRLYLEFGRHGNAPETPKPGDNCFANAGYTLIGSNSISLKATFAASLEAGFESTLYSDNLCGEAKDAAENLAIFAKDKVHSLQKKPTAILAGGETIVTLNGNGRGGRNQEMALAFAINAEKYGLPGNWVFLSGGSDGRDGPTDAAGGLVDCGTIARIVDAGLNPDKLLANNDSYTALHAAGDLLMTGATGTNVADLQVLLIYP